MATSRPGAKRAKGGREAGVTLEQPATPPPPLFYLRDVMVAVVVGEGPPQMSQQELL